MSARAPYDSSRVPPPTGRTAHVQPAELVEKGLSRAIDRLEEAVAEWQRDPSKSFEARQLARRALERAIRNELETAHLHGLRGLPWRQS